MRKKIITATGEADIRGIFQYLHERTPSAAAAYYRMALATFEDFPDDWQTPKRAEDHLPDEVRVLYLGSPFRGYTLRVAWYPDTIYLVSAFAPGLPDGFKDRHTLDRLRDL